MARNESAPVLHATVAFEGWHDKTAKDPHTGDDQRDGQGLKWGEGSKSPEPRPDQGSARHAQE